MGNHGVLRTAAPGVCGPLYEEASLPKQRLTKEWLSLLRIPVAEAGFPVPHGPGDAALFGGEAEVADVAGTAGGVGFLEAAEFADVDGAAAGAVGAGSAGGFANQISQGLAGEADCNGGGKPNQGLSAEA